MRLAAQPWRIAIPAFALVAGLCYLLILQTRSLQLQLPAAPVKAPIEGPTNKTLGFGAIMVLTDDPSSWRTQGLKLVADRLGLMLQTPFKAGITDDDVREYLQGDQLVTSMGSVRATMNYLSLLQQVSDTGVETVLLLEDDVDFSIHVKDQLEILSKALWNEVKIRDDGAGQESLRRPRRQVPPVIDGAISRTSDPYHRTDWDVLWLGHCGVEFTNAVQTRTYRDPYALPWDRLSSPFNNYYEQTREKQQPGQVSPQQIMYNATSLATYAWAITRSHAQWLLDDLHSSRTQRFDVAMHVHCKGGRQRCLIPVPELMHHHKAIGAVAIGTQGNGTADRKGLDWWKGVHKYTYNVEWSARCNAAGVGEKLEARWQCLPGKYDDVV